MNGHVAALARLIEEGGAVNVANDEGTSPVMLVAKKGHAGVMELLLKGGGDVSANDSVDPQTATPASTLIPLPLAPRLSLVLFSSLLAPPSARALSLPLPLPCTTDWIYKAARHGHIGIVRMLLKANADANAVDKTGKSALDVAVQMSTWRRKEYSEIAQLLRGAMPMADGVGVGVAQ